MNLKNKVVLITGAAGRIGESVAFDVAKYGGDLILNDIDSEKLKKLKIEILKENNQDDAQGAGCTALLVAVVSRKLELTRFSSSSSSFSSFSSSSSSS